MSKIVMVASGLLLLASSVFNSQAAMATSSWTTPVLVGSSNNSLTDHQIAGDDSGHVIAVFRNYILTDYVIQAASSSDFGQTWTTPVTISTDNFASGPEVTMDSFGHAVVIWHRGLGPFTVQSSSSSDYGLTWSTPIDISATTSSENAGDVVMDDSGHVVAIWEGSDGTYRRTEVASSTDYGATWSSSTVLSPSGQNAYDSRLAMDANGHVVAAWSISNGSVSTIQTSMSADHGVSWATAVSQDTTTSSPFLQIALSEDGHAVAVWVHNPGSAPYVNSSTSTDYGATWSTPAQLATPGHFSQHPQITTDASGAFIAAWDYEYATLNIVVQTSTSTDGGITWSTPVDVSTNATVAQDMKICMDNTGNAVLAWSNRTGSYNVQTAQSSDRGQTWGAPAILSSSQGVSYEPITACLGQGSSTVLWETGVSAPFLLEAASYYVPRPTPTPSPSTLPNTGATSQGSGVELIGAGVAVVAGLVLWNIARGRRQSA